MSYKIMAVEDSRLICAEMQRQLADTDIGIVRFCRSGEEAIEAYGDVLPDLVTMDVVLPGMDGLEAARGLLRRWPEARVLIVSSLAHDDVMSTASKLGAKGFLYKPFTRDTLIDAIYQALNR